MVAVISSRVAAVSSKEDACCCVLADRSIFPVKINVALSTITLMDSAKLLVIRAVDRVIKNRIIKEAKIKIIPATKR